MRIKIDVAMNKRKKIVGGYLSEKYELVDSNPDLIVTDFHTFMEKLDEIKGIKEKQGIPVMLIASYDDFGEVRRYLGSVVDDVVFEPFEAREILTRIEVLKEIEKKKREIKEILREDEVALLFSRIGHPVIVLSPEFDVLYANEDAETLLKAKGIKKIVGEKCYRIFHGEDKPLKNCPCLKLMETGRVEIAEMEMKIFNRTYLVSVAPIYRNKKLEKIIHLAIDISDFKEAEKRLRILYETNKLLHEIEKGVLSSKSVREILELAMTHLIEFLPVSGIFVIKIDNETEEILSFRVDCEDVEPENLISGIHDDILQAIKDRKAIRVNGLDHGKNSHKIFSEYNIRSFALFPVISDGFSGVMVVISDREEMFTDELMEIVQEIADSLSLAMKSTEIMNELAENEAKFRALAEKSLVGVDIIQDGVFVYVNPKFAEMLGYRREEIIGRSPLDFIHPDDRDTFLKNYRERIEGKRIEIHYMIRGIRKNGEIRYIETFGSRITLRRKPAIVGVSIDVTDKLRMQEELKRYAENLEKMVEKRTEELARSEARYRSLVESPIVGFWEADENGVFTFVNERFTEIIGYRRDEIVGKMTIFDLIPSHLRSWLEKRVEEMKEKRLSADVVEIELLKKDGSKLYGLVSPCPIYDEQGRHVKTIGALMDITERIEMENELRRALEELEAYARVISHDLRAPLRGLMGYADALFEEYSDRINDTARYYIERIHFLSSKMDRLISDLLEYAMVSGAERSFERVDMNEIVGYAIEMLREEIERKDAIIRVEELPEVRGDRRLLLSIIINLISNALKFVEKGKRPEIRIYQEDKGEKVRICVEDNGIGVPEEHRERIFNLFERLHGEEIYPGTGVGLAIVKKAVDIMGGKCGVDSSEYGSIFWIELEKVNVNN